jgi:rare lipoprotein A
MKSKGERRKAKGKDIPARRAGNFLLPPSSFLLAAALAVTLSGCGTSAKRDPSAAPPPARGGGYYLDDGPGANPPADLDSIPDAVPRAEPVRAATARPYVVMGRSYAPMTSLQPYRARGVATWYGRRYHGKQTASGEIYDMYAMTAAHTTLPIPSYARVTNLANGRSVVVRVNDRGPFIDSRLIDLSYSAAHRIGVLAGGSAMVEVETIIPGTAMAAAPRSVAPAAPTPEPAPVAPAPVAVPPPEMPAGAPQIPVTAESSGFYLQLAAFGSKSNAENFLERMRTQVPGPADNLHVYARDGLFRVHAGPYANDAEARQAADRISQALGVKPFVLTR